MKRWYVLIIGSLAISLGYLGLTYVPRMYFYGLVLLFGLIFLQTPRPSKTIDEEDMKRSTKTLRLLTLISLGYGFGGILTLFFL